MAARRKDRTGLERLLGPRSESLTASPFSGRSGGRSPPMRHQPPSSEFEEIYAHANVRHFCGSTPCRQLFMYVFPVSVSLLLQEPRRGKHCGVGGGVCGVRCAGKAQLATGYLASVMMAMAILGSFLSQLRHSCCHFNAVNYFRPVLSHHRQQSTTYHYLRLTFRRRDKAPQKSLVPNGLLIVTRRKAGDDTGTLEEYQDVLATGLTRSIANHAISKSNEEFFNGQA